MAIRKFNPVSLSAMIGIFIIFGIVWKLRSLEPLYQYDPLFIPEQNEDLTTEIVENEDTLVVEEDSIPQVSRPSFLEIATKHGTDKVTVHHYNYMYEKYLEPIRDRPLKMLEIGLGCDMNYGPGKSYYTWLEYLTNVDMYYIEYDKACVEKWSQNITNVKVFTGDQASIPFLEDFISSTGGGFDIIVEDGGHTMIQQKTSLNYLFPIIKPGGIYFCEDLATSYIDVYGGGEGKDTMMKMIQELLHDVNWQIPGRPGPKHEVAKEMRSVECGEQICAFFKKGLGRTEIMM